MKDEDGAGGVFCVGKGAEDRAEADAHGGNTKEEGDEVGEPSFDGEREAFEGQARDEAEDQAEASVAGGELEGAEDLGGLSVVRGVLGGTVSCEKWWR